MPPSTKAKRRRAMWPRSPMIGAAVSAIVLLVAVGTLLVGRTGTNPPVPVGAAPGLQQVAAGADGGLQPTGGTNSMGFPYVSTPGSASGTAESVGVRVSGANWALGHVPLSVAVRPEWTLTNTTGSPVVVGEPQVQILKGCCPGPFVLSAQVIRPGGSISMTFELAMHTGMDGWHDLNVAVPVRSTLGTGDVQLNVTGDFSD